MLSVDLYSPVILDQLFSAFLLAFLLHPKTTVKTSFAVAGRTPNQSASELEPVCSRTGSGNQSAGELEPPVPPPANWKTLNELVSSLPTASELRTSSPANKPDLKICLLKNKAAE
nr:hypothetical protein Iba_chr08dCG14110 [Ipomoea batatas]